jgi:hypothetical protein
MIVKHRKLQLFRVCGVMRTADVYGELQSVWSRVVCHIM